LKILNLANGDGTTRAVPFADHIKEWDNVSGGVGKITKLGTQYIGKRGENGPLPTANKSSTHVAIKIKLLQDKMTRVRVGANVTGR